MTRPRAS